MTRERQPIAAIDPVCLECGKMAAPMWGIDVWPDRPHLRDTPIFKCECGAWTFTHRGSDIPLGFPARGAHHDLCRRAQQAVDALIAAKIRRDKMGKERAKLACATWLAEQLGIEIASCHVPHMTKRDVERTIQLCAPLAQRIQDREIRESRARREAPAEDEAV